MTTNSKLTFDHTYDIRSYEPRPDGLVSTATICNHLQDIASRHADRMGFGFDDLEKSGHFWILARLHLMLDRLPGYREQAHVTTWPSGNERLVALRDFIISDAEGPTGRATTSWVTMNTKTHRPDNPDTVLDDRLIPDRERAIVFPSKAVTRIKDGEHSAEVTARRADTDINGHVNNVKYIEFCMEAVPQPWMDKNRCMGLDIQFRTESFPGDRYVALCSPNGSEKGMKTFLHSLKRRKDDKEIVRMKTWWKRS